MARQRRRKGADRSADRAKILVRLKALGGALRTELYEALSNNIRSDDLDELLEELELHGLIVINHVFHTYTVKKLVNKISLTPEGQSEAERLT